MKHGPKITEAQRMELLTSYLEKGYAATKSLAESFGVSVRYPAKLARSRGYINNHPRSKRIKSNVKHRRWQWAIERGAVLA